MNVLRWLLLGVVAVSGPALAQTYPDKSQTIKMIAPFGPGSSADALARALAIGLTEVSGLNVVVINKPGADGFIGIAEARQAKSDGYTMLLTTNSTQVVNPHLYEKLPYDPIADFIPLAGVSRVPMMVNVGPSVQFKTAREWIADAKANPGKYKIGSATSTTRVAGEMLKTLAGVDMLTVPYKNFSDAFTDVLAGRIDVVIVDAQTASAFYPRGVRAIATTISTRPARYPDVPTLQEEGVAGYDAGGWFAAYFPAKTPAPIVQTMREYVRKALQTKAIQDVFAFAAMESIKVTPEDMEKFQRAEFEKWGNAVRAANLPKQ